MSNSLAFYVSKSELYYHLLYKTSYCKSQIHQQYLKRVGLNCLVAMHYLIILCVEWQKVRCWEIAVTTEWEDNFKLFSVSDEAVAQHQNIFNLRKAVWNL